MNYVATEAERTRFEQLRPTSTLLIQMLPKPIHFADSQGKSTEMSERLLRGHLTEACNVGRAEELVDLAAEIGLDRAAAEQALKSGTFPDAVAKDRKQAQAFEICGVPFTLIDGKYAISGAQETDTFLQALRKVGAEH
ncbi:DsbA family oxidoreductase [Paracoccus xiamenensis]|uniref:DsbA family oxidoreductase n=1 Tax=Paracoccus xiamenensis TaxID=2714901 RepID=UPI00140DA29B|nr:DsbA family protein [Paracoccus xiamenensis]NHF72177.1 thioredoxin domain-containing protein [Paracoccus xiamenensis]